MMPDTNGHATQDAPSDPTSEGATSFADEAKAFVLHDQFLTTIEGERVRLPKCTYGKEVLISNILGEVFSDVLSSGVLREDLAATSPLSAMEVAAKITAQMMRQAPQKAGEVVAILLVPNGDDEPQPEQIAEKLRWVRANLTLKEVVGLVIPFLRHVSDDLVATVGPIVSMLMQQAVRSR